MQRITWEGDHARQTGYILGEANGYKAKIEVFAISHSKNVADAWNATPWILAHRLPFRGIERKFGNLADAQKHAERYLVYAFDLMGFAPKETDSE
jgi:hypothetical protein